MTPPAALWRGMLTALFLFVPAALLNLAVSSDADAGPSPLVTAVFYVVILLGAGAGGWATIRLSPDAHLWYASASPTLAYLVVQGFGIVRRLLASEQIRWGAYVFHFLLVATCGMLGGMFARRLTSETGSRDQDRNHSTTSGVGEDDHGTTTI